MIKITNSLIAFDFVGVLSLAVSSPALAKKHGKASSHRAKSPSHQQDVRRPVPVAPIVRCRFGVWDPYGVRCDDYEGNR